MTITRRRTKGERAAYDEGRSAVVRDIFAGLALGALLYADAKHAERSKKPATDASAKKPARWTCEACGAENNHTDRCLACSEDA